MDNRSSLAIEEGRIRGSGLKKRKNHLTIGGGSEGYGIASVLIQQVRAQAYSLNWGSLDSLAPDKVGIREALRGWARSPRITQTSSRYSEVSVFRCI